jgi:hypothetical protein
MTIPTLTDLLHDALSAPAPSTAYRIGRALSAHFPPRVVLPIEQGEFDPCGSRTSEAATSEITRAEGLPVIAA